MLYPARGKKDNYWLEQVLKNRVYGLFRSFFGATRYSKLMARDVDPILNILLLKTLFNNVEAWIKKWLTLMTMLYMMMLRLTNK